MRATWWRCGDVRPSRRTMRGEAARLAPTSCRPACVNWRRSCWLWCVPTATTSCRCCCTSCAALWPSKRTFVTRHCVVRCDRRSALHSTRSTCCSQARRRSSNRCSRATRSTRCFDAFVSPRPTIVCTWPTCCCESCRRCVSLHRAVRNDCRRAACCKTTCACYTSCYKSATVPTKPRNDRWARCCSIASARSFPKPKHCATATPHSTRATAPPAISPIRSSRACAPSNATCANWTTLV
mmetsp:Transcript_12219/g.20482  ORF Transcript_12219/g.20482 Transcript_12219/m.20482 type:complete len:239 (-) Transcript_12219:350-1066(-)